MRLFDLHTLWFGEELGVEWNFSILTVPVDLSCLFVLNTGHSGPLAAVHATSAYLSLSRLTAVILMAGAQWPVATIKSSIADALQ